LDCHNQTKSEILPNQVEPLAQKTVLGAAQQRNLLMAKTPIGKPIPVGDLPSLTEDTQAASVPADNLPTSTEYIASASAVGDNMPSLNENTEPEALPSDNVPAPAVDMQSALPSPEVNPTSGWFDLIQMSWQLALLPAMTWSSLYRASWKAWESAAQPQWPAR
jgi:hypothetical protein